MLRGACTWAAIRRHSLRSRTLICAPMSSNANCKSAWTPSAPLPRAELLHVLMLPDLEHPGLDATTVEESHLAMGGRP